MLLAFADRWPRSILDDFDAPSIPVSLRYEQLFFSSVFRPSRSSSCLKISTDSKTASLFSLYRAAPSWFTRALFNMVLPTPKLSPSTTAPPSLMKAWNKPYLGIVNLFLKTQIGLVKHCIEERFIHLNIGRITALPLLPQPFLPTS